MKLYSYVEFKNGESETITISTFSCYNFFFNWDLLNFKTLLLQDGFEIFYKSYKFISTRDCAANRKIVNLKLTR